MTRNDEEIRTFTPPPAAPLFFSISTAASSPARIWLATDADARNFIRHPAPLHRAAGRPGPRIGAGVGRSGAGTCGCLALGKIFSNPGE
jgi:hypothetical protein